MILSMRAVMIAEVVPLSDTCLLLSVRDDDNDGGAPLDRAVKPQHFKEHSHH